MTGQQASPCLPVKHECVSSVRMTELCTTTHHHHHYLILLLLKSFMWRTYIDHGYAVASFCAGLLRLSNKYVFKKEFGRSVSMFKILC